MVKRTGMSVTAISPSISYPDRKALSTFKEKECIHITRSQTMFLPLPKYRLSLHHFQALCTCSNFVNRNVLWAKLQHSVNRAAAQGLMFLPHLQINVLSTLRVAKQVAFLDPTIWPPSSLQERMIEQQLCASRSNVWKENPASRS